MAKARLETEITGDEAPFIRSVENAEKRAQTFSGRITSLFKRDPGHRAESALSGLVTDLTSGNIQGAITSITEKISGLGLVAGVGIGVAAGLFIHFREQAIESDKSIKQLAQTIGTFDNSGRSVESLAQHFQAVSVAVKDALEKSDTLGARVARIAEDLQPLPTRNRRRGREDAEIGAGLADEAATLKRQGEAAQRLADIKKTELFVSSSQAILEKIAADASERRAKITDQQLQSLKEIANLSAEKKIPEGQAPKLFESINKSAEAQKRASDQLRDDLVQEEQQKDQIRQRDVEHENRLIAIRGQGLSAEQEKFAIASENARSAQMELTSQVNITKEKRAQLQLSSAATEGELRAQRIQALRPLLEKAQLSFQDLLKPISNAGGVTGRPQLDEARSRARESQRLENIGEEAQGRGDVQSALKFFLRAEEEKSKIGILKESEKSPFFQLKNALSETETILNTIAQNTAQPSRPVNR